MEPQRPTTTKRLNAFLFEATSSAKLLDAVKEAEPSWSELEAASLGRSWIVGLGPCAALRTAAFEAHSCRADSPLSAMTLTL